MKTPYSPPHLSGRQAWPSYLKDWPSLTAALMLAALVCGKRFWLKPESEHAAKPWPASRPSGIKLTRPSTLLLNTQTEREAMGHLSKYYPSQPHSSGVSNQGDTRHQNTPLG